MSEFYNFEQETKTEKVTRWLKRKTIEFKDWSIKNKEIIIIFGPIVIAGVTKTLKFVAKAIILDKEKKVKDLYCYDRSLGHYWALRRELTNAEWVLVDKRKANGERLADILDELKVLK